jgi:hypothetical protein
MNLNTSSALNHKLDTHQVPRSFLAARWSRTYISLGEALRQHHEAMLRHTAGRPTRLQNRIGTPV